MRTTRQILAARLNGARSRGPVTAAGKQRVSRNAITHGLYSEKLVLAGEDRAEFQSLAARYHHQFQPVDDLEAELVDMMIAARWRQLRLWNIQRDTLDLATRLEYTKAPDPAIPAHLHVAAAYKTDSDNSRTLEIIARQEARYERQYMRAHKRLLDLRAQNPQCGAGPQPAADSQSAHSEAVTSVPTADTQLQPRTQNFSKQTRAHLNKRRARRLARTLRRSQQRKIFLSDENSSLLRQNSPANHPAFPPPSAT